MKQAKEFKVVRSYERGDCYSKLQELLNNGWEVEHASEYIPPRIATEGRYSKREYFGYIEYILSRPIKTEWIIVHKKFTKCSIDVR